MPYSIFDELTPEAEAARKERQRKYNFEKKKKEEAERKAFKSKKRVEPKKKPVNGKKKKPAKKKTTKRIKAVGKRVRLFGNIFR